MHNEIKKIADSADLLHTETEVELAIDKMAANINKTLHDKNPLILCVMNGGLVISGKLLTRLTMPCTVDAINVSRYGKATSGGQIEWIQKPKSELKNRTVLIVDDILDEGFTLEAIIHYCQEQESSAVYSAVLVNKILPHKKPVVADFIGLEVENRYLFGYGMDYKGYLRNAPGIYACSS
ncbi:MAG: hypoxanthine-guanine phosphoribosyltransferase [Methylococcales bacterium]